MHRLRETVALALVALAAVTVLPEAGWNATAHYALVESLADGTPKIDGNVNQGGDIAWVDGHFYAAKAPGLALVSVPLYAVFAGAGLVPEQHETESEPPGAFENLPKDAVISAREDVAQEAIWEVNLVVVAALFILLLLIRAAADRVAPRNGTPVALLLGLGTLLLPFATAYFAHVLSAMLGFAAFAVLLREQGAQSAAVLAAAGALAGLAIVVELPLAIVAAALGVYVLVDRPRLRRGAAYTAGVIAGVLPLLAYNTWALGAPWRTAYAETNEAGLFGLTRPHFDRLVEMLFSDVGLFVLTPVTAVALVGLFPLVRRGHRREAFLVAGLTAAFLLYNASYFVPLGGWVPGPRFLVPLLPFLALPLAAALARWPAVTLAAGALSAFWMIAATLGGATISPEDSPTIWLSHIAHGQDLAGTILTGDGTFAPLAFLLPATAAVCLVAIPRARDYAGSREMTRPGPASPTGAKRASSNRAAEAVDSSAGSDPSRRG